MEVVDLERGRMCVCVRVCKRESFSQSRFHLLQPRSEKERKKERKKKRVRFDSDDIVSAAAQLPTTHSYPPYPRAISRYLQSTCMNNSTLIYPLRIPIAFFPMGDPRSQVSSNQASQRASIIVITIRIPSDLFRATVGAGC